MLHWSAALLRYAEKEPRRTIDQDEHASGSVDVAHDALERRLVIQAAIQSVRAHTASQ